MYPHQFPRALDSMSRAIISRLRALDAYHGQPSSRGAVRAERRLQHRLDRLAAHLHQPGIEWQAGAGQLTQWGQDWPSRYAGSWSLRYDDQAYAAELSVRLQLTRQLLAWRDARYAAGLYDQLRTLLVAHTAAQQALHAQVDGWEDAHFLCGLQHLTRAELELVLAHEQRYGLQPGHPDRIVYDE